MNIFVLELNPYLAAKYHCDKHVVKMIVETAQILSSVHYAYSSPHTSEIYKKTHYNHPCCIWARKTRQNYLWTLNLLKGLFLEYTKRYKKIHKTERLLKYLEDCPIKNGKLTSFAQAMPEQYRSSNVVEAYRNYYKGEKSKFAKWNYSEAPEWWNGIN